MDTELPAAQRIPHGDERGPTPFESELYRRSREIKNIARQHPENLFIGPFKTFLSARREKL
ncbi:hypothetical protein [Bounagaea algeriensis]